MKTFAGAIVISTEAVAQRCSVKKVFLEISQKSQENTSARVSFMIKLQAPGLIFDISRTISHLALWTYFTPSSSVSIVNNKHVIAGCVISANFHPKL